MRVRMNLCRAKADVTKGLDGYCVGTAAFKSITVLMFRDMIDIAIKLEVWRGYCLLTAR